MPCNADYMEPNEKEIQSKKMAQHIIWLDQQTQSKTPTWIVEASKDYYGNVQKVDQLANDLCERCQNIDQDVIYNGRDKFARKLADWWDRHQEADKIRIKKELDSANNEIERQKALDKLTDFDKQILGL